MEKENLELAVKLRHELHAHPELSCQEEWTKEHIKEFLTLHAPNLTVKDKGTYLVARYDSSNPDARTIAFRADYDALPMEEGIDLPWGSTIEGVAHKCGHDGHASALAGFALEVSYTGAPNNIVFIFQPAEEVGKGALMAKASLAEEGVDKIFGWHNMSGEWFKRGVVSVKADTVQFASKGMSVFFTGSPAHASEPENGVNPAYAIAKIVDAIPDFVAPENNHGLVLCTIVQVDVGSCNFGMAAYEGTLRLTLRAEKELDMDALQANIEAMANEFADKQHMTVRFEFSDEFPETANDESCAQEVREACERCGIVQNELPGAIRASEDFGYYLKEVPGAYFYIGNGESYPSVHTYEYDFIDDNIEVGVEVFKGLAGMR